MSQIQIRGETFELLPERALHWPKRHLLVIADLHLGKAETFQSYGLPLPTGANAEDLDRITALIEKHEARHVLFLGDLVHAVTGVTGEVVDLFAKWIAGFRGEITVALGNHDIGLSKKWPEAWRRAELVYSWSADGIVFQHEPPTAEELAGGEFFWIGHIHPMVVLRGGPDRMRLPCFAITGEQGWLPAFSSLAGGHNLKFARGQRLYAIGGEKIVEIR